MYRRFTDLVPGPLVVLGVALLAAAPVGLARADHGRQCPRYADGRPVPVSGSFRLQEDYTQEPGDPHPCFLLVGGADLYLNGHGIDCKAGGAGCGTAIEARDPGSKVIGAGSILGTEAARFAVAIRNVASVRGLRIEGADVGIRNEFTEATCSAATADDITQNVIVGSRIGIDTVVNQGGDLISNNVITCDESDGSVGISVRFLGTATPQVTCNFVRGCAAGLQGRAGCAGQPGCYRLRISDNVFDSNVRDALDCGHRFCNPAWCALPERNLCAERDQDSSYDQQFCAPPPVPFKLGC